MLIVVAKVEIKVYVQIEADVIIANTLFLILFLVAVQAHLRQLPRLIQKFQIIFQRANVDDFSFWRLLQLRLLLLIRLNVLQNLWLLRRSQLLIQFIRIVFLNIRNFTPEFITLKKVFANVQIQLLVLVLIVLLGILIHHGNQAGLIRHLPLKVVI